VADVVLKVSCGLALAATAAALLYRLKDKRETASISTALIGIGSFGVAAGLLSYAVLYIRGQIGTCAPAPLAAGAVCLAAAWLARPEHRGHPLGAALLALSPSVTLYAPTLWPCGSKGVLPLLYVGLTASGCGLVLMEGIQGVSRFSEFSFNLRRLNFALLLLLTGVMLRAWWDKLALGIYWTGGLEGKGGLLVLLSSAALINLHHLNKRLAALGLALVALLGLWGLMLRGI